MAKSIGTSELTEVWGSERVAQSAPALTEPTLATKRKGFVAGLADSNDATWAINVLGEKLNHVLQNGVPEWNATTTYAANDFASGSGRIWRAVNPTTNSAPSLGNANWEAVTLQGDLATIGASIGDIKMTAYATPEAGWALCNGQAISRSTYSALFAKIGTTYGVGNGSTTFNLPQTENLFIQGAGASRPVGTTQAESGEVNRDGWGTTGGALGSATSGRLIVGSSQIEINEGLESLRAAGNNGSVTNIKPANIAFHYMIKII